MRRLGSIDEVPDASLSRLDGCCHKLNLIRGQGEFYGVRVHEVLGAYAVDF